MRWKETLPGNTKSTSDRDPGVMWMPERWALDGGPLCGIHSPKRGASERPPEKASCWEELLKAAAAKEKGVPPAIALSSSLLSAMAHFSFRVGLAVWSTLLKLRTPAPFLPPYDETGLVLSFSVRGGSRNGSISAAAQWWGSSPQGGGDVQGSGIESLQAKETGSASWPS